MPPYISVFGIEFSQLAVALLIFSTILLPPVILFCVDSQKFSRAAHIAQLEKAIEADGRSVGYIVKRGPLPISYSLVALMFIFFALSPRPMNVERIGVIFFAVFFFGVVALYFISRAFDAIILTSCGYIYIATLRRLWETQVFQIDKRFERPFLPTEAYGFRVEGTIKYVFIQGEYKSVSMEVRPSPMADNSKLTLMSAENSKRLNKIYLKEIKNG